MLPSGVIRQIVRGTLILLLLASAGFAAWSWFRPYDWKPDPGARCKIQETLVMRDVSNFWIHVHLKLEPGMAHDLQKPVWLETVGGKHEPADSTFGSISGREPSDLWFKFWLEPADLGGDLVLHMNDGKLVVRSGSGAPDIRNTEYRNFTTTHW